MGLKTIVAADNKLNGFWRAVLLSDAPARLNASAAGTAQLNSPCARHAVSALILVLLWLMIVRRSPFDAYATAQASADKQQSAYRNFGDWLGDGRSNARTL